jgi:hypothetical protein
MAHDSADRAAREAATGWARSNLNPLLVADAAILHERKPSVRAWQIAQIRIRQLFIAPIDHQASAEKRNGGRDLVKIAPRVWPTS